MKNGAVLGLFIFASFITLLITYILDKVSSASEDIDVYMDDGDVDAAKAAEVRNQLVLVSGR